VSWTYFSLGSNLGNRADYLRRGLESVVGSDRSIVSGVYETEPVGGVIQDDFWNLVVGVETTDSPAALLARCERAEELCERVRDVRWGPRTLDVDVIWADHVTSDDASITIPHPRFHERAFVLVPLETLAPHIVTPALLAGASGNVRFLGTLEELL
jgi:2-amino-4-hydroxy-6-hydroxymethyldihydropteridine diphosphokinase